MHEQQTFPRMVADIASQVFVYCSLKNPLLQAIIKYLSCIYCTIFWRILSVDIIRYKKNQNVDITKFRMFETQDQVN